MEISDFHGDRNELRWNFKDLGSLERIAAKYIPVERRWTVVQAGGCLGVFASWLSRYFQAVYMFEPEPLLFGQAVRNIHNIGNPERCVLLQAALGFRSSPMFVRMVVLPRPDKPNSRHPGMAATVPGGIIPVLALDELQLPKLDLLYLDIEGAELEAVLGAEQTILRCRPVAVVCEVNAALELRGHRREDLFTRMRLLGYQPAETFRSDQVFVPE